MHIYHLPRPIKWLILFGLDGFISAFSIVVSLYIIGGPVNVSEYTLLFIGLVVTRLFIFWVTKLYGNVWRYASLDILMSIIKSLALSQAILGIILLYFFQINWGVRFILVDTVFMLVLLSGARISLRILRELEFKKLKKQNENKKNVLIIGAGDAGESIVRELKKSPKSGYTVIGFVDDDRFKQRSKIAGVSILGHTRQMKQIVKDYHVEEAIIAIPSAPRKKIQRIVRECKRAEITYKITPHIIELINGFKSIGQLRDVNIEDLLGRDIVDGNIANLNTHKNKTVLITGAGGSIGSEIARQVFYQSPKKIIILDHSEFACYEISRSLNKIKFDKNIFTEIVTVVGDIKNRNLLANVFENNKIEICYHAAAYKHVPLMEENIREAIRNNVGGTFTLASTAQKYNVDRFILISTDKAVNPTNIMGASKRVCELILQILNDSGSTIFSAVRFGNVLGSNGSVVPLFREQIKQGGPITVTDPNITRYFMTIEEAVRLVLQAGHYAKGGEIFILDMGTPVKIVELARSMINLSGLVEGVDINIEFSGLRKGEKMFEELSLDTENLKTTEHSKIFIAHPTSISRSFLSIIENLVSSIDTKSEEVLSKTLFQVINQFPNEGI